MLLYHNCCNSFFRYLLKKSCICFGHSEIYSQCTGNLYLISQHYPRHSGSTYYAGIIAPGMIETNVVEFQGLQADSERLRLQSGHSCDSRLGWQDSPQVSSQFPSTQHCPARCFQFLDQRMQRGRTVLLESEEL